MKKASFTLQKRNFFLPFFMLCLILFILYTIIDTAIRYDSIPLWAVLISCLAGILLIYAVIRFSVIRYEYLFIGNELVIRKYSFNKVSLATTIPIENIRSVVKPLKAPVKPKWAKPYNLCNTIRNMLFSSMVIVYTDVESACLCKALIDPPNNVRKLLKLNLERKYRV